MEFHVVLRNFLSVDTSIILTNVEHVEHSDYDSSSFIIFYDKDNKILGEFDKNYIKGYYKV